MFITRERLACESWRSSFNACHISRPSSKQKFYDYDERIRETCFMVSELMFQIASCKILAYIYVYVCVRMYVYQHDIFDWLLLNARRN